MRKWDPVDGNVSSHKKKKVVYMRLWGLPALGWHSGSAMAANALPSPGGSFHLLEVEGVGI